MQTEPGWETGNDDGPKHVHHRRQNVCLKFLKATAKAISPYIIQALGLLVGAATIKLIKVLGLG